ncbi:mandelate racemase/muconate lactonizing enzyme family protein [Pelagibacterium lacus]|uniref:Mandelate racemase/muconate lactonizing enzyme family protein n=1 Tax=Pelagibacterium lacus TaxID=2282655 RepID=A0A369VYZ8_9HYPH|nr:mandelate racemase/muconate lactonizing enzyme family protein [Pelagibacterium lacus]RDE07624.1 mandelate racemase/muconate lactonizing enzyme family protein [Pelagibacterium lacus]
MRITNITASLHKNDVVVPDVPDSVESRIFVFVEVETDTGIKGHGVTGVFLPWAVISCIEQHLLPTLKGLDPLCTEHIHSVVWNRLNIRAYTGVISHALSAVDIALWDIRGKHEGQPVYKLLGGNRNWAPTYATFGYPFFDADQIRDYGKKFVTDGHSMLKMVVGANPSRTWRDDVKRVRAAREAIGPDIGLMIDANYYYNPHDAFLLARGVKDCDLIWFEEPLHQNDARALADLRRQTGVPIAAGQNEGHRWRYRELIEHQAVDVLQPNVLYNGGFTESLKVAHMAQAFNLPVANGGGWPIFNMHLFAGVMNGGPVEFHHGMWVTGKRFFKDTPDPINGRVTIPDRPGLGFEPNYEQLKDARINSPDELSFEGRDSHGYLVR